MKIQVILARCTSVIKMNLGRLYTFQVRFVARPDRKELTSDRHVEDTYPRRVSSFPEQRRVQARQVSSLRRSLHELGEPVVGRKLVAFRQVSLSRESYGQKINHFSIQ